MSYGMVHQLSKAYGTLKLLSDSRVAVAIRAGLVEMCLNFVQQFGVLDDGSALLDSIGPIFKVIHHISAAPENSEGG